MKQDFHYGNRQRLYRTLPEDTLVLLFSGHAKKKTADEDYPFYADRNFVYLTGLDREGFVFLAEKSGGRVKETVFILPPDAHDERWSGKRMRETEAKERSGIEHTAFTGELRETLHRLLKRGRFANVALDLYKDQAGDEDTEAFYMAEKIRRAAPAAQLLNLSPHIRRLRTIKQPCEIEAMRRAALITRDGIVAMMRASRPGMYEYQYKAEFDYALAQHGVLEPAFPSIISAGDNNFCIHYHEYTGQAKDGDMVLNDVGAKYDGLCNDVSRGWPCNGVFSGRQRQLYQCAYNTSEHMFSVIRPGMAMGDVDRLAREFNFEQLKAVGLCSRYEDVDRYIWHGGAHHVGWDVHDLVDASVTEPGMVFCVDIGIYCEEWGIGFRLEDNCLVTEDGCENLTAAVPRSIDAIEAVMAGKAGDGGEASSREREPVPGGFLG